MEKRCPVEPHDKLSVSFDINKRDWKYQLAHALRGATVGSAMRVDSFESVYMRNSWLDPRLTMSRQHPGVNSIKKYKCTLQVGPLFLQIHTNLNPLKVLTSFR